MLVKRVARILSTPSNSIVYRSSNTMKFSSFTVLAACLSVSSVSGFATTSPFGLATRSVSKVSSIIKSQSNYNDREGALSKKTLKIVVLRNLVSLLFCFFLSGLKMIDVFCCSMLSNAFLYTFHIHFFTYHRSFSHHHAWL
jgi:hypothetical protein